jgi:hypothetical protein
MEQTNEAPKYGVPKKSKAFVFENRAITLYPFGKSSLFKLANNFAHIFSELRPYVDFKVLARKAEANELDITRDILPALVTVSDRIEGDIEQIVVMSTKDVTIEELRAGEEDIARDFDPKLLLALIGEIVMLNKGVWMELGEEGLKLMEKIGLVLKEETGERNAEPAAGQPEAEPEAPEKAPEVATEEKVGASETGGRT